ncbi:MULTISPECIES: NAD(P)/FAD-dependent oxidoreductase [unclassified Tardiphaga]|uniref:NAD(P)/FAD-dependent oxidoreductase n=1 Tax=unclassified Tardiphaga TaxID=2631404 RepID=UPI001AEDCAD6|nr:MULTISPECIES: FAD/NAD(P)-binding oxidoreductase [unclassified Tardiphaga]
MMRAANDLKLQNSFDVVVVGGGAAGITVSAALLKHRPNLRVAIVEPSETHAYQPGWTLVGAGVFTKEQTIRQEASLIPKRATWIKASAATFAPENNEVSLSDGSTLNYHYLVMCPGLKLNWEAIAGLKETLGRNGVCSNYSASGSEYTWRCLQDFRGGTALFSQPPMPIKCAGAPQKIMYLAADYWRKHGKLAESKIEFCLAGDVLFGVPFFVTPLQAAVDEYGITLNFKTNLKAINGAAKEAIFAVTVADGVTSEIVRKFDMIHVAPPQTALDFVKQSSLANEAGWVDVDQATLEHNRFKNVFGLGDGASTPNAKTAAAVRMQAPVVVSNLLAVMDGNTVSSRYDGYGSCPLTVAYGKIVLAEFGYGGKVTPSFPFDPRVPRWSAWILKTKFLPWLYWSHMLKGGEFDIPHKERKFAA